MTQFLPFLLGLLTGILIAPAFVNHFILITGEGTTPPPFDAVERRIDDYLADLISDRSTDA